MIKKITYITALLLSVAFSNEIQQVILKSGEHKITLEENQKLSILDFAYLETPENNSFAFTYYIEVPDPENSAVTLRFTAVNQSNFVGPATIVLSTTDLLDNSTPVYFTYRVESLSTNFSPLGTAIIPSDEDGDFTVNLESSTDLQTWSNIIPGDYSSKNNNQFFRVNINKK